MRFFSVCLFIIYSMVGPLAYCQDSGNNQEISISGVVTTFKSLTLNQVQVKSLKAKDMTKTDSLGRFLIRCQAKDILLVNASGFDGKRIKTKNSEPLIIDLVYSNKESSFAYAVNNNHISEEILQEAINTHPVKGQKDYSKYNSIYELIENEIHSVRVSGSSVTSTKIVSLNLPAQVLFIVDGVEASSVSNISPLEVKNIKYSDGVDATMYGVRGANGVISITLK